MAENNKEKDREKKLTDDASLLNTLLVHFYRGELQRANTWQMRLDETPNYAIVITAAIITWAFSSPQNTHVMLLFSDLIIFAFLYIESRRYRSFEVWRSRIQILEENFIAQMLVPEEGTINDNWKKMLAEDLKNPTHKVTALRAIAHRLHRVYIWLFVIIFIAWVLKLGIHPDVTNSLSTMIERARISFVPGMVVVSIVTAIFLFMVFFSWWGLRKERKYMGAISEEEPEPCWEVYDKE